MLLVLIGRNIYRQSISIYLYIAFLISLQTIKQPNDGFIHIFTLAWGHFNHSNFKLNLGFLKYFFNNPEMHIWHHAKHLPENIKYGVNFGLTLSVWDYLFKTDYIPYEGRDIELGFEEEEDFPQDFKGQIKHGF